VQGIRLDEQTLEVQLTLNLIQHSPFVVFTRGIGGLANRHTQLRHLEGHPGNVDAVGRRPYADPPLEMGSIDPLMALPSQTI
jgi:hypothetical protein